jgi:homoserine O-succinyltransferase/O-acetyltransferase
MPVRVVRSRSHDDNQGGIARTLRLPHTEFPEPPGGSIRIGLVNNMPDAAFKATEHQFVSLLDAASESIDVQLSLYTMPAIPRTESIARRAASHYASVETLWDAGPGVLDGPDGPNGPSGLDGLIVTGKDPISADLRDEPCWQMMTQVIEWAQENTHSTVWSCLAAHAAVLHMDGIRRRRNGDKCFGVFACARVSEHPLLADTPLRFSVPHSRWNGLSTEELEASGYRVLARTADAGPDAGVDAGVDTFVKEGKSLFVFFQGHPEYERDSLLREYRRDVERYLRHEASAHPGIPSGYFDHATERALAALREKAMSGQDDDLNAHLATALKTSAIENTWHKTAARIYKNWLEQILARKNSSRRQIHAKMA